MAIEDYVFPMQSLTSKAAMSPEGMSVSPFFAGLQGIQGAGSDSQLGQVAGMVDQYADIRDSQQPTMQANSFAQQTPGAPSQPGRVGQPSVGSGDPMQMLMANIAKRFGGQ